MAKKKIAIQCPCSYTRQGIENLLRKQDLARKCKLVTSINHFGEVEERLKSLRAVDIIIVTLSSAVDAPVTALSLFGEYLPNAYPGARILFITDLIPDRVMARYLRLTINSPGRVFDTSSSLSMLKNQLVDVVETMPDESTPCKVEKPLLSLRENTVLRRILDGDSISVIARGLKISIKTVSHYKRSALVKLNIKTLQPLLINTDSKNQNSNSIKSSAMITRNTHMSLSMMEC